MAVEARELSRELVTRVSRSKASAAKFFPQKTAMHLEPCHCESQLNICGPELFEEKIRNLVSRAGLLQRQPVDVMALQNNLGGLTVKRGHETVQNIYPGWVDFLQTIGVDINVFSVVRQFLDGIYEFIGRGGVEVAIQFQIKAVAVFEEPYPEV